MNEIDRYTDPDDWHAIQAMILVVLFGIVIWALVLGAM